MLLARKRFSCGSYILEPGDVLTDEIAMVLPAGRVSQLKEHGWLEERTELSTLLDMIQTLEARVAVLEAQSDEPTSVVRRGRPPKVREEVGG